MLEIIGWTGAFLLSICGIPQLLKTYKTKTTKGLSILMLLCWLVGESMLGIYIVITAFQWPLLFNSIMNITIVLTTSILWIIYRND